MPIRIPAAFLTVAFLRSLNKVGRKAPESSCDVGREEPTQEVSESRELESQPGDQSLRDRKAPVSPHGEQNGEIMVRSALSPDQEKTPDDRPKPKI
jgi:hypothetical protein